MTTDTKLPLVVVKWNDAWVKGDAPVVMSEVKHEHKPMPVTTIGWLLLDDEIGVQIANEFYDDAYRGRTFIMRSMVVSVTHHTLAKPRPVRTTRGRKTPQVQEDTKVSSPPQ